MCTAALLLAACQQPAQNTGGNETAPESNARQDQASGPAASGTPQEPASKATGEPVSRPEAEAKPAHNPLGALPPADRPQRFVGRWAASEDYCEGKAWRFTATSLSTPAGSECRFTKVDKVPGGYDIAARCTAEGPETADRIKLRFAESARAMLFESKTIAGAGLVWCGE